MTTKRILILLLLASRGLAQLPGTLIPWVNLQFTDNNGQPLALGKVCTYQAGTNLKAPTYTTAALTTQNQDPIVLDSSGRASIFIGLIPLKVVIQNPGDGNCPGTGSIIRSIDNIQDGAQLLKAALAGPGGASLIGFEPTGGSVVSTVENALNSRGIYDFGFASMSRACGSGSTILLTKVWGQSGSNCVLTNLQSLIGPAPLTHSAAINYTGTGNAITNASSSSAHAIKDFSIIAPSANAGILLNGLTGLNVVNTTISGIDFNPLNTSIYADAPIVLQDTFGIAIANNFIFPSPTTPYGIDMSGASLSIFNDTNYVGPGNIISGTSTAAIRLADSSTGVTIDTNIIESNACDGILAGTGNPSANLRFTNNHFENNSVSTPCWDIHMIPGGASPTTFNTNGGPNIIDNNEFNSPMGLGAIYLASIQNPQITNNRCSPSGGNVIKLGPGVINPVIYGNKFCNVELDGGRAIADSAGAQVYQNRFIQSANLTDGAWSISGSGVSIDNSGSPTIGADPAWNLHLGATSCASPAAFSGVSTATMAGRLVKPGIWVRTASGTAFGSITVSDGFAVYTGTTGTPGILITSTPQWISLAVTTAAADSSTAVGVDFKFCDDSGASTIIIADPDLCFDSMTCTYVPTGGTPALGSINPYPTSAVQAVGTFTPGLTFGGGSAGIAYTGQFGDYIQQGQLITARMSISISGKGSSTGAACITGLPFTSASNIVPGWGASFARLTGVTSTTGMILGQLSPSDTKVCLFEFNSGGFINLDDTTFSAAASVQLSVTYHTD